MACDRQGFMFMEEVMMGMGHETGEQRLEEF